MSATKERPAATRPTPKFLTEALYHTDHWKSEHGYTAALAAEVRALQEELDEANGLLTVLQRHHDGRLLQLNAAQRATADLRAAIEEALRLCEGGYQVGDVLRAALRGEQ